jgi:hypothetical protein
VPIPLAIAPVSAIPKLKPGQIATTELESSVMANRADS